MNCLNPNVEFISWVVELFGESKRAILCFDEYSPDILPQDQFKRNAEKVETFRKALPFNVSIGYLNYTNPTEINISIPKPIYGFIQDDFYILLYPERAGLVRPRKYNYVVEIYSLHNENHYPEMKYRFNPEIVKECLIPDSDEIDIDNDNKITLAIDSLINATNEQMEKIKNV